MPSLARLCLITLLASLQGIKTSYTAKDFEVLERNSLAFSAL